MSRFALTFVTIAGIAVVSASFANAAPRKFACDDVSTWSECEGTPTTTGHYKHVSAPRPNPGGNPPTVVIVKVAGPSPEGNGSIAGSGGGAGGGGGGGGGR